MATFSSLSFSFTSASDVDKDYLIFELTNVHGQILFDISMSDEGQIEISFGEIAFGEILSLEELESWIKIGKNLVLANVAETDATEEANE